MDTLFCKLYKMDGSDYYNERTIKTTMGGGNHGISWIAKVFSFVGGWIF